jgi:predicted metal-dependent HD superfamily phosphohydrolase
MRLWLAATKTDALAGSYERLVAMYSEPHRYYHNLRHISDCLEWLDRFAALAREPLAVELAIWFHDAVYDTRASDNEERSAQLARNWLSEAGADAALVDSAGKLVLATQLHDGSLHPDAPLLVDVDLSILGQPEARFWEYEEAIRREYDWVPAHAFAAKRAEILEGFLSRKRLYQTDALFQALEEKARANLQASIRRLKSSNAS